MTDPEVLAQRRCRLGRQSASCCKVRGGTGGQPENYIGSGAANYRHVSDGTALCHVNTRQGCVPAEPVEHQVSA
jgi:hypothetical protein